MGTVFWALVNRRRVSQDMGKNILQNVTESIGDTPLVKLTKVAKGYNIYGKMEYLNPGGSV